ncbi:LysR family transcriptional regulator [Sphingomonas sp. IBVSS1]|nr:LysR family transcriptional regulator [Sphingomonas sp. IBVSS1]
MSEFSDTELRRLDLTLLLVFLGLVRHRKAIVVAAELGLTPSAVSQALKRLRHQFGDPLFLRQPHGLEPTAIALALAGPVGTAVEALRHAMGATRQFDPATASGIIRLAALDAAQIVLVPALIRQLQAQAPGLQLAVLPLGRGDALAALASGEADAAIGFIWNVPDAINQQPLYTEDYLVAGPPALLAGGLDLETYLAAPHVLVSPGGGLSGIVDEALAAKGRNRRVIAALPAFLPALVAASAAGALVTLPRRIALAHAASHGLAVSEPPLAIRPYPVALFWHRRNDGDARREWLAGQLVQAAA